MSSSSAESARHADHLIAQGRAELVRAVRRAAAFSADTALRLARYFATTDRFWLNLQTRYDLEIEKDHLGNALDHIEPLKVV